MEMEIYTDGSCDPNPGRGGWAWVRVIGEIVEANVGWHPTTTNNRMELQAIIDALEHIAIVEVPLAPVVIYTDSKLCINTLTGWAAKWEKLGWKRNRKLHKPNEVKNLDLVQKAWKLVQERRHVRFEWVRGHSGNYWNEYADRLAAEAGRSRPEPWKNPKPMVRRTTNLS